MTRRNIDPPAQQSTARRLRELSASVIRIGEVAPEHVAALAGELTALVERVEHLEADIRTLLARLSPGVTR
jgi:hypothetical protein